VSRSATERIDDIEDAVRRILSAELKLDEADGTDDSGLFLDAILYRLLVIGEAVKALPDDLLQGLPTVPWTDICRLRDLLAHQYHRVEPSIIRSTCDQPLAALSAALPALRALIADELMLDE
jgi:uncharacterized protein with HEPN domain